MSRVALYDDVINKKERLIFMSTKHLTIRIDDKMLDKLHVVADYEGRSANSQVLILIRDSIEKYEEKHGEITFNKK